MARAYSADACAVAELAALLARTTDPASCPSAIAVERNIPIYDAARLDLGSAELRAEWAHVLREGPGVLPIAAKPTPVSQDEKREKKRPAETVIHTFPTEGHAIVI